MNRSKPVIINGSGRTNGHTARIVKYVENISDCELKVIELIHYNIGHYDYQYRNQKDDFYPLIQEIMSYDVWIMATPVYWYAMSGRMKVFLDRFTDLLKVRKDMGRLLTGKSLALISCGSDSDRIEGFAAPFEATAKYLNMKYLGDVHCWLEQDSITTTVEARLKPFVSATGLL